MLAACVGAALLACSTARAADAPDAPRAFSLRAVQEVQLSADQRRAVDSLVRFLRQFGRAGEADELESSVRAGRIRIGPVPDNDNADTNIDTKVITLNTRMVEQILQPSLEGWKFTADWAATIRHEQVHATQSARDVIASNVRHEAGGDQPHEIPAWGAGFQATYDWMNRLIDQLAHTSGEAAREAVAQQVRALAQNFIVYEQNYTPQRIGTLRLVDKDQLPVPLADALAAARRAVTSANAILVRADFRIRANPPKLTAKAGETIHVSAVRYGGAYGDPTKANTNDGAFTYRWIVGGKTVGQGRSIARVVTKSENLVVEVQDQVGAKRSATCVVTVEPAPAARAAAQPAPAPAAGSGGHWVLEPKPIFTRTDNPGRVQGVNADNSGFRGTFKMDNGQATELWGKFSAPPASMNPGDMLVIDMSTNYDMEAQINTYHGWGISGKRALNNGGFNATVSERLEKAMPPYERGNNETVGVQVTVTVGAGWWIAYWQYTYKWEPTKP